MRSETATRGLPPRAPSSRRSARSAAARSKEETLNFDKTLIIVLIIVLVTMGPSQLPKIARMLGKSARALRDGIDGTLDDEDDTAAASPKTREASKE